ncbi:Ulp1 protease family, C-terminal catalytic domain [Sesbania bispinosa]|nr:Ulp1 protease family, C-terminal catalytic domain [Sesbania bispinosa]
MAGNGKEIASPKGNTWRRHRARIRNRPRLQTKRKRVSEEMDISSSFSEKKDSRFDKGDTSSHEFNHHRDQIHHEVTLNEVKKIKKAVNNLTMMMVNYMPIIGSSQTPTGLPLLISNQPSPKRCSSDERQTKSEPCFKLIDTAPKQGSKDGLDKRTTSGANIPMWMPVVFRPPKTMLVDELEAKVTTFIFSSDHVHHLPGNEILIRSKWVLGDRETLKTLMPTKHLHPKVIDMIVCRLTYNEKMLTSQSICWFLPTMFAKYALETETNPETVIKLFKGNFMSTVEHAHKIFVPIHDGCNHWYLLVVDMEQQKLILLDSNRSSNRREWRRLQARKLALFIQEMLMDNSFYEISNAEKPEVAGFTLVEPKGIAQELPQTNDSGVWVATWMIDHDCDDEYDKLSVRMLNAVRIDKPAYNFYS